MIIQKQTIIEKGGNMEKDKVIEIVKKKFGTSDEDLQDLGVIMDALEGVERADYLEKEIANLKAENEKALKDLDETWRTRYRDRFFNGDTGIEDVIDKIENPEDEKTPIDITLEDYIEEIKKEGVK